jgi:hypothetical protein
MVVDDEMDYTYIFLFEFLSICRSVYLIATTITPEFSLRWSATLQVLRLTPPHMARESHIPCSCVSRLKQIKNSFKISTKRWLDSVLYYYVKLEM